MIQTPKRRSSAFTFAEMMVASAIFSMVAVGLMTFTSTSVRLVTRNLATNHSHEAARISAQRMLGDLHEAASSFRLVTFDGLNFTDVSPAATADRDPFTKQYLSSRANGVRFRRLVGGPCKLAANTTVSSTDLTFDFGAYQPQPGDKLVLPLITREFTVIAISNPPSGATGRGSVTISEPIGFTINTVGAVTTGYFCRRVAYTVFGNALRFHSNYPSVAAADTSVVRGNITSPKPFALLYPATTSASTDGLNLRVSLETYDLPYSARTFFSGTTTHQAIIPPRNQPALVTN